jgi:hypothetical protein
MTMNRFECFCLPAAIISIVAFIGFQPVSKTAAQASSVTPIPAATSIAPATNTAMPATPVIITATPLPTSTETPLPTVTSTIEAVHYGPDRFPKYINPFTGLKVDDPAILDRRPVMVKVSNFPPSGRPQFGLSEADLVFEYYIGEGIHRVSAIYYGEKPEKVGPVRSARLADIQLASMYQTIFAYASADVRVRNDLINHLDGLSITVRDSTCPALCDTGEHTVNSVFANVSKFDEYAKLKKINNYRQIVTGMVFDSIPPETSKSEGNFIVIRYNDLDVGAWKYDPSQRKYLRWTETNIPENPVKLIPLNDQLTGKQVAFDNVVLLYARYNEYNPTLHNIELWANHEARRAVFFRDGHMITGYWQSQANDRPMVFFDDNNKAIPLKPGNTWFVIIGLSSTVDQANAGQWNVQFSLP